MAGKVYGLDLGTYEIKVFDKKQDKIWREKDAIAMKNKKYIFAVGNEAYEVFEKAPVDIRVVFPMRNGVIAHFDDMQYLLGSLLETGRRSVFGAEYVVAVPTDVTEVEKKAFYDLVLHSEAKAKSVRIVEKGLADAVGFGMDVIGEKGIFVANFGGGTTELSVLSLGGMVMNRLLKIGGENFDNSIADLVRHNREFLIGTLTAEKLRREFGVSPGRYRLLFRLDTACRLLRETGTPIAEIAEKTGFHDLKNFYRMFRKHTGMPPGKYRAENQQKNETH